MCCSTRNGNKLPAEAAVIAGVAAELGINCQSPPTVVIAGVAAELGINCQSPPTVDVVFAPRNGNELPAEAAV